MMIESSPVKAGRTPSRGPVVEVQSKPERLKIDDAANSEASSCRRCGHEASIHSTEKTCLAMTRFGPCLCEGLE
jgi:hypothetical protein